MALTNTPATAHRRALRRAGLSVAQIRALPPEVRASCATQLLAAEEQIEHIGQHALLSVEHVIETVRGNAQLVPAAHLAGTPMITALSHLNGLRAGMTAMAAVLQTAATDPEHAAQVSA